MRVNLRPFPDNMRTTGVNFTTKRHLRYKYTRNRFIRHTFTTIHLSRTTSRHIKFIQTRHNRNLTVRVLQKFSHLIQNRQAPSNTQLLLRLRGLFSLHTLNNMRTRINRVQRHRVNLTIIHHLFNTNLYRHRSIRVGTSLLRMPLILHRMSTSIINI